MLVLPPQHGMPPLAVLLRAPAPKLGPLPLVGGQAVPGTALMPLAMGGPPICPGNGGPRALEVSPS